MYFEEILITKSDIFFYLDKINSSLEFYCKLFINTEEYLKSNKIKNENAPNLYSLKDSGINLANSLSIKNNNKERIKYFSEEKVIKKNNEKDILSSALEVDINLKLKIF